MSVKDAQKLEKSKKAFGVRSQGHENRSIQSASSRTNYFKIWKIEGTN